MILAAAFTLAIRTHAHSQSRNSEMVGRLETQITQQIEIEQDLKQELTAAEIDVMAALAMPEAEGGIAVGTVQRWGQFCKDFLKTQHKLEIPNLWAKRTF
jgi:hypothetical protein